MYNCDITATYNFTQEIPYLIQIDICVLFHLIYYTDCRKYLSDFLFIDWG